MIRGTCPPSRLNPCRTTQSSGDGSSPAGWRQSERPPARGGAKPPVEVHPRNHDRGKLRSRSQDATAATHNTNLLTDRLSCHRPGRDGHSPPSDSRGQGPGGIDGRREGLNARPRARTFVLVIIALTAASPFRGLAGRVQGEARGRSARAQQRYGAGRRRRSPGRRLRLSVGRQSGGTPPRRESPFARTKRASPRAVPLGTTTNDRSARAGPLHAPAADKSLHLATDTRPAASGSNSGQRRARGGGGCGQPRASRQPVPRLIENSQQTQRALMLPLTDGP